MMSNDSKKPAGVVADGDIWRKVAGSITPLKRRRPRAPADAKIAAPPPVRISMRSITL